MTPSRALLTRLLLAALLWTALPAPAATSWPCPTAKLRAKSPLLSLRLYSANLAVDKSVAPHFDHVEAEAAVELLLELRPKLGAAQHAELARLVSGHDAIPEEPPVPAELIARLRAKAPQERNEVLRLLRSRRSEDGIDFERWARHEYRRFHSLAELAAWSKSLDEFYGISKDIAEVARDGRIDLAKVRRQRCLRSAGTEGAATEVADLPEPELERIIFTITRDPDGRPRMRVGGGANVGAKWGFRSHAIIAQGRNVELAGELFLLPDGRVAAANLRSGHYMTARQSEIDAKVRELAAGNPARTAELNQEAAEADERHLRELLTETFKLELATPPPFGQSVFSRMPDWVRLVVLRHGNPGPVVQP